MTTVLPGKQKPLNLLTAYHTDVASASEGFPIFFGKISEIAGTAEEVQCAVGSVENRLILL
jgi:hypothetical protein